MIKHHYNKKQTFLGKLTVSWGWFELESKHRQTHQVNNICLSQLSALQTWKNSFMCCSLLFCSPFNQQTRDPKFESHWVTESFSSCLKRCKYFTRSQTFPVRHPSQKEPDPFETASIKVLIRISFARDLLHLHSKRMYKFMCDLSWKWIHLRPLPASKLSEVPLNSINWL